MPRTPQKSATPVNAADQAAQTLPERTPLQPADHEAFFAGLDTPPAPTEKLRTAFARHRGNDRYPVGNSRFNAGF